MNTSQVCMRERIVSAISYFTMGWGGMLYLIVLSLKRRQVSRYIRFNVFQSIFLSFLYFILAVTCDAIFKILSYIPYLNYLTAKISQIIHSNLLLEYSLIQVFVFSILIYTIIFSILGKIPRIYWVSDIINKQVR